MKKILSIAILSMMILLIVGCGKGPEEPNNGSDSGGAAGIRMDKRVYVDKVAMNDVSLEGKIEIALMFTGAKPGDNVDLGWKDPDDPA